HTHLAIRATRMDTGSNGRGLTADCNRCADSCSGDFACISLDWAFLLLMGSSEVLRTPVYSRECLFLCGHLLVITPGWGVFRSSRRWRFRPVGLYRTGLPLPLDSVFQLSVLQYGRVPFRLRLRKPDYRIPDGLAVAGRRGEPLYRRRSFFLFHRNCRAP